MIRPKRKTITELRASLFETFDEVAAGETQIITHKNGSQVAMVPMEQIEEMKEEVELHKNLAIGYAQALRGEGVSTNTLKKNLKAKEKALRKKHG
jgi:prevent-host-death family protein